MTVARVPFELKRQAARLIGNAAVPAIHRALIFVVSFGELLVAFYFAVVLGVLLLLRECTSRAKRRGRVNQSKAKEQKSCKMVVLYMGFGVELFLLHLRIRQPRGGRSAHKRQEEGDGSSAHLLLNNRTEMIGEKLVKSRRKPREVREDWEVVVQVQRFEVSKYLSLARSLFVDRLIIFALICSP